MKIWIDILPPLPLAIGLPVIIDWNGDAERQTVIAVDDAGRHRGGGQAIDRNDWDPRGYVSTGGPDGYRVDLNDPQGMAYAIRIAVSRGVSPAFLPINAWVRGETTDTDRLTVARELAKTEGGV